MTACFFIEFVSFFGKGSLLRNEPQYPTKGYCMLHTAAKTALHFFLKDFILIKILIKIQPLSFSSHFILNRNSKILVRAKLSEGHAGATTSPAEDSEADGGAPVVPRPAQPCPPCQVRGGTCGGTAFDILA